MKRLRIALLSRVWESVPPKAYGGTELIVDHLANQLVKRGHDVTLFASGDSKTPSVLASVISERTSAMKEASSNEQMFRELANIKNCFDLAKEFDVIHNHTGVFALPFIDLVRTPVVSTLHTLIRPNQEQLHKMVRGGYFCSISKAFQKVCPQVEYYDYVYNGVEVEGLKFNANPQDHLINIGRIVPDKGFKEALEIAKAEGKKIRIAGPLPKDSDETNSWLFDKKYWDEDVKPLLNDEDRVYVGEIADADKSKFFGNARALLFPLQWEEPFGLTVVEAMACGTPVITYDRGAMGELVENGKTGFVIPRGDVQAMSEAVRKIYSMTDTEYGQMRQDCRERAEGNFSVEKMVEGYEKVYYKVIGDTKG